MPPLPAPLPSFEAVNVRPLQVLGGHLREYRHVSGAALIHVDVPDPNLTVSVSFRTPPTSNSGHAHVLEHMVLLGSRQYPSPRAFSDVQRWTLLDYLNASTTRDWTAFTASSSCKDDAWTVLSFFLDAAFHPLLTEATFRQEAWRVTPEGAVSGVVYNEMRGALTHPARRMREAIGAALFPGTPYTFQAGGTPDGLLQLDLAAVRAFHAEQYVPANAVFYLYGQAPLDEFAALLHAALQALPPGLPQAAPAPCLSGLPGLSITHPRSDQTLLAWALPPQVTPQEMQALNVLALTLLGHSDAPLCRAMRALGGELADGTGFHADTAQPVFAIGCRSDVTPEQLQDVVTRCLAEPLPPEDLQAALGRYALGALDTQHNGFPYGVQLSFDVLGAKHHGHDPYPLNLGGSLEALRAHPDLAGLLHALTQRYLLGNAHRSVICMRRADDPAPAVPPGAPDARHGRSAEAGPATAPAFRVGRPLASRAPGEAFAPAPLGTVDVQGQPVEVARVAGALTQASLTRDLGDLGAAQVALLPVYLAALPRTELGRQLTVRLHAHGAHWSVNADTTHDPHDPQRVRATVTLNLRGLSSTFAQTLQVLADTWGKRPARGPGLHEWLRTRAQTLGAGVGPGAAQYAMLRAARRANPGLGWRETFDGLASHALLRAAADAPRLEDALSEPHRVLWEGVRLHAVLVGDDAPERLARRLAPLLGTRAVPSTSAPPVNPALAGEDASAAPLPGTAAHALPTVPYSHPDAALLTLLGCVVHERLYAPVRAQGGAYGVTARSLPEAGLFLMVSARDPQPQRTQRLFEQIGPLVDTLTPADVEVARIAAFRLTCPLRSAAMLTRQAALDVRNGYSPQVRRAYREALLLASPAGVQQAARWLEAAHVPPARPGNTFHLQGADV